ncbi:glutamate 5-kinase [Caenispirillum bisanense]|uniref:glutamate 5-kinase n=1 Tax=Caenispirillum bisanense TaxID=414052 RepID=UPI0031DDFE70
MAALTESAVASAQAAASPLAQAKRIIIKIGSALLVDEARGEVHRAWLDTVADDIAACKARGQEVVVVTSGSIAVGRRHLGLPDGPLKLEEKQAAAATGQGRLAHAYQETLARHGITAAQVLLTIGDTEDRRRYLNGRNTLDTLLRYGAVPVINENDTVATTEIRFGDNDRLAARVGMMIGADALVLLSDIDGLYTADPKVDPTAELIPEVREMTPAIEAMAGEARPGYGSGGMVTKLMAARICMGAGTRMAIARGKLNHPLRQLEQTGRCTWFIPKDNPRTARKNWIAGRLRPAGTLHVDDGAAQALAGGRSLLPAGVTMVEGTFERGDAVQVKDADGRTIAKGLIAYNSHDANLIAGHKTADIEDLLGYRGRDEMIHRDDLVLDA